MHEKLSNLFSESHSDNKIGEFSSWELGLFYIYLSLFMKIYIIFVVEYTLSIHRRVGYYSFGKCTERGIGFFEKFVWMGSQTIIRNNHWPNIHKHTLFSRARNFLLTHDVLKSMIILVSCSYPMKTYWFYKFKSTGTPKQLDT